MVEYHKERYNFDSPISGMQYEVIYSRRKDAESGRKKESVLLRALRERRMSLLRSYDKILDREKPRVKRTDHYELPETEDELMERLASLPKHIKYFFDNVDEVVVEDNSWMFMGPEELEEPPVGLN